MSEYLLLKTGTIQITTKVARFDNISFQISNIGSVAVYHVRRLNLFAVTMFIGSVVLFIAGANLRGMQTQEGQICFAVSASLLLGGFVVQSLWPKKEFTFVLKTANDTHKIISLDGEYLDSIQHALESAFVDRV